MHVYSCLIEFSCLFFTCLFSCLFFVSIHVYFSFFFPQIFTCLFFFCKISHFPIWANPKLTTADKPQARPAWPPALADRPSRPTESHVRDIRWAKIVAHVVGPHPWDPMHPPIFPLGSRGGGPLGPPGISLDLLGPPGILIMKGFVRPSPGCGLARNPSHVGLGFVPPRTRHVYKFSRIFGFTNICTPVQPPPPGAQKAFLAPSASDGETNRFVRDH